MLKAKKSSNPVECQAFQYLGGPGFLEWNPRWEAKKSEVHGLKFLEASVIQFKTPRFSRKIVESQNMSKWFFFKCWYR